ncbi:MAG TPA: FtsX-like permease family protein [Bryobacteraceae bacterium]
MVRSKAAGSSRQHGDIGPRYFATLRTPVLRGREFDVRDDLDSPRVAIVNQTLAQRLWPHENAIGEILLVNSKAYRVIGLVEDVRLQTRAYHPEPYVYVPYWQNPLAVDARLCVRVHGDPAAMLSSLVREVHRVDPDVPIAEIITLPLQLNGAFQPLRLSATFVSYVAGLAVLLSAMGVYGTLAFAVSRRTKEIGIRMALGAKAREIRAMIVWEEISLILVAILAGLLLATVGQRLVRHLLLGAAPGDMFFYAAAALLVLLTGLFACWIPARRAARVEPMVALRED